MELKIHLASTIFYYPSVLDLLFWIIVRVFIRIFVKICQISIQNVLNFRIVYLHRGNKCTLKSLGYYKLAVISALLSIGIGIGGSFKIYFVSVRCGLPLFLMILLRLGLPLIIGQPFSMVMGRQHVNSVLITRSTIVATIVLASHIFLAIIRQSHGGSLVYKFTISGSITMLLPRTIWSRTSSSRLFIFSFLLEVGRQFNYDCILVNSLLIPFTSRFVVGVQVGGFGDELCQYQWCPDPLPNHYSCTWHRHKNICILKMNDNQIWGWGNADNQTWHHLCGEY